jgi:hypothetical protein
MSEGGSFVSGYVVDEKMTRLVKAGRGDKEGAIAQYALQWDRPEALIMSQMDAGDSTPFVQWVRQLIVLLATDEAARTWFDAKASRFRAYSGRTVDGFKYGDVHTVGTPDIGEQAELVIAPNSDGPIDLTDTYVHMRRGRLFASVSASAWGSLEPRSELQDLARALDARMRAALS